MTDPLATAAKDAEVLFVGARELRTIPKGWQHPMKSGKPRPLFSEDMPDVSRLATEQTEIAAYETTTEGTPISPAFPNDPAGRLALVAHCAEHACTWGRNKAGAEAWAALLFGRDAAVTRDGVVVADDQPRPDQGA